MNGNSQQKRSSGISLDLQISKVMEAFLLVAAGGLAAYMHFHVRIPLNIPGHHGLEFMAILSLIRLSSVFRFAGTLTMLGTGIVLLIPGMGGGSFLHGYAYLLPGLILDVFYLAGRDRIRILLFTVLISGVAYMTIPLSRTIMNALTAYPYMALVKYGVLYTTLSFFFFGMMGGLLGYSLFSIRNAFMDQSKNK